MHGPSATAVPLLSSRSPTTISTTSTTSWSRARTGGHRVADAIQTTLVARFYERLGDHAVHIAERIRYLADGG